MWTWLITAAAGVAGFWWGRHSRAPSVSRPPTMDAGQPVGPAGEPFSLVTVISGLAHELRNPLSNLKLNLQLVREDLAAILADQADHPMQRRILARFETGVSEAGRLERTLEQFLQFASNPKPQLRRTEMIGLIAELLDFFAPQAAAHQVCVRADLGSDRVHALVDPVLLKQAVLNLLINAQQAMPGGGELILRTRRTGDGGRFRVDVIDTGAGIGADQIDRIFQAYYSTKKGGTGLGLPISRKIVQAHGGTLTVSSEVGKGSDFCIELPVEDMVDC